MIDLKKDSVVNLSQIFLQGGKTMENEAVSRNFIEQIIDKDLAEGRCETVCTRFPPEPNR